MSMLPIYSHSLSSCSLDRRPSSSPIQLIPELQPVVTFALVLASFPISIFPHLRNNSPTPN